MWNLYWLIKYLCGYSVLCVIYEKEDTPPSLHRFSYPKSAGKKLIQEVSDFVFKQVQTQGGKIPYLVIKELVENFYHADFAGATISLLSGGNTIYFSDTGKGISPDEKNHIFEAGFTTATKKLRRHIRGAGSGLFLVRNIIQAAGGKITVENNLKTGVVLTVSFANAASFHDNEMLKNAMKNNENPCNFIKNEKVINKNKNCQVIYSNEIIPSIKRHTINENRQRIPANYLSLSERQAGILAVASKEKEIGPSLLTKFFHLSPSTAYREIKILEDLGLLTGTQNGKRSISETGKKYLQYISPPVSSVRNDLGGFIDES